MQSLSFKDCNKTSFNSSSSEFLPINTTTDCQCIGQFGLFYYFTKFNEEYLMIHTTIKICNSDMSTNMNIVVIFLNFFGFSSILNFKKFCLNL